MPANGREPRPESALVTGASSGIGGPQAAAEGRVARLRGGARAVLAASANGATVRLRTRRGNDVVRADGEGCRGPRVQPMGRDAHALAEVRNNSRAGWRELEIG